MKIVENRNKFFMASIIIIAIGIIAMIYNISSGNGAFRYSVEFSGGTSIHLDMKTDDFNNDDISKIITDTAKIDSPQIQKVIGTTEVIIKTKELSQEDRIAVINAIKTKYSITDEDVLGVDYVSATISIEMQKTAVLAVAVACIAMLIYITLRFKDVKMGATAIIALLHDAIVLLSFYAIIRIPLSTVFIAVMLTILGYSINSTIIEFDRVRENKKLLRKATNAELINTSIQQTLKRSIYTTLTTLMTITMLYIFGVQSVKEFALPIMVGIICGTYSSVCLAGPIWFVMASKGKKGSLGKKTPINI